MIKISHIHEEQTRTLQDIRSKLSTFHKCAVIRPTGFGKTYLLTELIKDYKNVLYLYPSAVVRDTVINRYYELMTKEDADLDIDQETIETCKELGQIENCTLMTYAKLIRLSEDEIINMDYDLIIFDEMHRLGGPKTKIATEKLFVNNPDAYFVGATATPLRMDRFDAISVFFSDIMTYSYTLADAIHDNILKKPNYCYCTYDIKTDIKNAMIQSGENISNPDIKSIIDSETIRLSKIYNMPTIIRSVCDKYSITTSYLKFIVFFSNKDHMSSKLKEVVSWFEQAYPDHKINTLAISSRSTEERNNTAQLGELKPEPNKIDIIACIDMLNMGYHVTDHTGIIMYRSTDSSSIFIQQLGRALSAGTNNSAIVFDIVDNLHRKAIYNIDTINNKTRFSGFNNYMKLNYFVSEDGYSIMTVDENGVSVTTQYHLDDNNNIIDIHGNISTLIYDDETGYIYSPCTTKNRDINNITSDCINMTSHEASYREIIAKTTAEPMKYRCRSALELHFRTWCEERNIEYPVTEKDRKRLYSLSKTEFYEEFCKIIDDNAIDYPLQDAQKLLSIGNDNSSIETPLKICAKARDVSVDQILDVLGISNNI